MTKTKLLFTAMSLALVAWMGASAASAQNGPSISVSPTYVAEAGEATFTVTGSGWTVSASNVGTCNIPADADLAEIDASAHCSNLANLDIGNLTAAPVTDGGFEVSHTVNVPEQGVFIVAGDLARTQTAGPILITVGTPDTDDDMDDMDDDMDDMDDDMSDDMDDMDDDMMGDDMDDMSDDMMDDDMLAETGSNSTSMAIIAVAVVLAGAMLVGLSRRLRTQ